MTTVAILGKVTKLCCFHSREIPRAIQSTHNSHHHPKKSIFCVHRAPTPHLLYISMKCDLFYRALCVSKAGVEIEHFNIYMRHDLDVRAHALRRLTTYYATGRPAYRYPEMFVAKTVTQLRRNYLPNPHPSHVPHSQSAIHHK